MPTFTRTKRTSRSALPRSPTPPNGSNSRFSLCQARLDRIARPTLTYFRTFCRTVSDITTDPRTYTSAVLVARAAELGPKIAALRRLRDFPPPGTTGEEWEKADNRLSRWLGQMDAIALVLRGREARPADRRLRLLSGSGSAPVSGSAEESPVPAATWDPFATQ